MTSPTQPSPAPAARRRVVVTGASSGIGAATVTLLCSRGFDVVAVARQIGRAHV